MTKNIINCDFQRSNWCIFGYTGTDTFSASFRATLSFFFFLLFFFFSFLPLSSEDEDLSIELDGEEELEDEECEGSGSPPGPGAPLRDPPRFPPEPDSHHLHLKTSRETQDRRFHHQHHRNHVLNQRHWTGHLLQTTQSSKSPTLP